MNKFILSIAVATTLISCSEVESIFFVNKTNPAPTELKITTKRMNKISLRWKETYKEKDSIGIYLFTMDRTHFYPKRFFCKNRQAKAFLTREGRLEWKTDSTIFLPNSDVFLYAYFPYHPENLLSPYAVPIRIASRAERTPAYRFGRLSKGHKALNGLNPTAWISMKPVLADLSFRLRVSKETKGTFYLEAIQVGNKPGGTLCRQKGFLNLSTGEIKSVPSTAGATRLTVGRKLLSSVDSTTFRVRALPTSRPAAKGEIEVLLTINHHTYTLLLPPGTAWKSGYNYLYELIFDGEKVELTRTTCSFI